MNRRTKVALGIWFVTVSGVVFWQFLGRSEPLYDRKPLTAWLQKEPEFFEEAEEKGSDGWRAVIAIRHIGQDAVPYLVEMARVKDSPLKKLIISAFPFEQPISGIIRPAKETRQMAVFGFYALGPMGKDAVPALIELLRDKDIGVRYHAAQCLGYIGPDAESAIPQLLLLSNQPDRVLAWTAMSSVGKIHKGSSVVVPALITNLLSTNRLLYDRTMLALGDFGGQAQAAAPFILPFLNDADELIRADAASVLKQIVPEVAAKAGIQ
jgi:HEAT repeat protein